MCGRSARTTRSTSAGVRVGSSARSAASILCAYVTPSSSCSTHGGRSSRARTSRSPLSAWSRAGERPVVVVGPDRLPPLQADRAGVEPLGQPHDRDAGLRVAGHDRPLDRRSAAPARQQRRMHVEDLVLAQQRLANERAVGAETSASGSAAAIRVEDLRRVQLLGRDQLEAERASGVRDRRGPERAPASLRAVRACDTSAGRCGPAASRSSTAAANSEVPR